MQDLSLTELFSRLSKEHTTISQIAIDAIVSAEQRLTVQFPNDMRQFYSHFDGADCFAERYNHPFRILNTTKLDRVSRLTVDPDDLDDSYASFTHWIAFCDMEDGNYASIDCEPGQSGFGHIYYCDHEVFARAPSECPMIASSFSMFLERVLNCKGETSWRYEPLS